MLPTTKPDKKVPTHGPGTTAWYRGKEAKILAIENGKAKIFCDGRVLLVNYTSLDDASFKTLHEAVKIPPLPKQNITPRTLDKIKNANLKAFVEKYLGTSFGDIDSSYNKPSERKKYFVFLDWVKKNGKVLQTITFEKISKDGPFGTETIKDDAIAYQLPNGKTVILVQMIPSMIFYFLS